jgi:hypothetical protein
MKVKIALLTALVLLSGGWWIYRGRTEGLSASEAPVAPPVSLSQVAESPLPETIVAPSFGCRIPPGKNVVWCSTFQMAWDRLKTDVLKEPIVLRGNPELAKQLNSAPFPQEAILPESFYAVAGWGKDGIVEKIRGDMKRKFPDHVPDLSDAAGSAIVAYAYLQTSVPFTIPYFERRKPLSFRDAAGKPHLVRAFGIRTEEDYAYDQLRAQIGVLHAAPMVKREEGFQEGYGEAVGEFIVDPDRNSRPYQILLAKVKARETLAATWAEVEASILRSAQGDPPGIGCNDIFLAPNIQLATTRHFKELEGRSMLNPGARGLPIQTALQSIRFVLNRSGAELGSEAKMLVLPIPRYFVIDGPFLVVLRKRGGREPFFTLWVANPEVLELWPTD